MGRPGTGGGGHRSSGSHSRRSSGGHRMSSSRPGVSHSSYSGSHYHSHHRHYYGGRRYYGGDEIVSGGPLANAVAIVIILLFVFVFMTSFFENISPDYGQSTRKREKVTVNSAFDSNCIFDETGWIENEFQLRVSLENFFRKTGVQPCIVMKDVKGKNMSDSQKEDFANEWYDKHIDNEGTFLYMYFDDGETGSDIGYMCYVCGRGITDFVDQEAIEMFWNILDYQWVQASNSMTEVFTKTFSTWSKRCMKVTFNLTSLIFVGVILIFILTGVIFIIDKLRKKEKEKAEHTERILNAPLNSIGSGLADSIADKYD